MKSYGGANWIRLYVSNDTFFRASDVVYVLMYPHTPIVIASQMKVKMKDMLLSVSSTREIWNKPLISLDVSTVHSEWTAWNKK